MNIAAKTRIVVHLASSTEDIKRRGNISLVWKPVKFGDNALEGHYLAVVDLLQKISSDPCLSTEKWIFNNDDDDDDHFLYSQRDIKSLCANRKPVCFGNNHCFCS